MKVRKAPNFRFNPEFSFVQAFLSEKGLYKPGNSVLVFEVYVNRLSGGLVCTCPGFLARLHCVHTNCLYEQMVDGKVSIDLEGLQISPEIKELINKDSDFAFFYISNYGKVRVLNEEAA